MKLYAPSLPTCGLDSDFWSGVPAAWALHVALMVLSLGLTLLSGANYLWKNRALIAQAK